MPLGQLFVEIGVVILALAFVGRLAGRIGFSPIPLYLLAGILIGPVITLGGEVKEFIHIGAEIGAVLLLFTLGLEYTEDELRTSLRTNVRVGVLDLVLNFTPGLLLGFVLGFSPLGALLLGGVTYLSSSGIVSKVLGELGRLGNRETPVVLAVCVLEDIAMAVYLPVVAALLVAGIADLLKVSAAIGAFLVGIALSGDVANRARQLTAPLRDFFAAIFFVFFGLQLDLGSVPAVLLPAVILTVVTALTKIATGWWGAARAGVGPRGRYRAGATLVARGEFSILIAGLAVTGGVAPELGPLAAVYVLLTAALGPVLARLDRPLAPYLDRLGRRAQART